MAIKNTGRTDITRALSASLGRNESYPISVTQYNLSSIVAARSGKLAYLKLTCCVGMYCLQRLESFCGTRSRSVLEF